MSQAELRPRVQVISRAMRNDAPTARAIVAMFEHGACGRGGRVVLRSQIRPSTVRLGHCASPALL